MGSITIAELRARHEVERSIFRCLVLTLTRNPAESLLVMSLWMWLEEVEKCQIIAQMLTESPNLVDALANEAVLCLACLQAKIPTRCGGSILLTSRFMGKRISLQTLTQVKYTATSGVKTVLNSVCSWIFTDILLHVLPSSSQVIHDFPLSIPGFPHPYFGPVKILNLPISFTISIETLWGWRFRPQGPEDDRTMFLTFSSGFPVSEVEVRHLFTSICGNCVESFTMGKIYEPDDQPLYARMVLNSVTNMDRILNGNYMARLKINGKHIWARKFEQRDGYFK